jgi:4-hydroxybenzoate polyprenyltransferase
MLLAGPGWPGTGTFALVTLAMVGARTAAMALNRVIDAGIDAKNPRTAAREIPTGMVGRREGVALAVAGVAVFAVAGWALNPLTLALLPLAVVALVLYPYTKRVTWACHLWLGLTVGAAAPGGYIAVTGAFEPLAWLAWAAVASWVAGFDVVYGLLDRDFDRRHGLHSVPARFGVRAARWVALGAHALSIVLFVAVARVAGFGVAGWLGVLVVGVVFAFQHALVARRGAADALRAFDANMVVGVSVLAAVVLDLTLRAG